MLEYVNYNDYDMRGWPKSASDKDGNFIADIFNSKLGDAILIAPRSGGGLRKVIELAVEFAKAATDKEVGYDWNAYYHPVGPRDTVTEVMIRHDARSKPGEYLELVGKGADTYDAEIKRGKVSVKLFDVAIDAIRLSRENGNKAIEFGFNSHRFSIRGNDDAEQIEQGVPEWDRVTNVPKPTPPPPPQPQKKLGKFTITG